MTLTNQQSDNVEDNIEDNVEDTVEDRKENQKKENVDIFLVMITIVISFLCVFGVTKIKTLKNIIRKRNWDNWNAPFRNFVFVIVISILIGIFGLFNSEAMDIVGNQLRPILVFMSLTAMLLFTKFSSRNDDQQINISKDNMLQDLKKTSDDIIHFIKNESNLFDFVVFNSVIFVIIIIHKVISKYVTMNKKYIDLIQQFVSLLCFLIMLGFYHSTSSDVSFTYIIVCLIIFYLFRILHKIDQIAKIGIGSKILDLSALEYDNVDFLKYIQMIFNGLFLVKFFS